MGKTLDTSAMLPIGEESLLIIESCGFEIVSQGQNVVNYKNEQYDLLIDQYFGITIKENGCINTMFPIVGLADEDVLTILDSMKIIDLKPIIRDFMKTIPLPGGNAAVFTNIRKAKRQPINS